MKQGQVASHFARAGEILLTGAAVVSAGPIEGVTFEPIEARVGGSAGNFRAVCR